MDAYGAALADLFARSTAGIKLGLDVVRELLRHLGEPQRRFACVVVGGTNGKGTTSSLLARALAGGGHRVGLYTSPHLLRFTERIRVLDGQRDAELGRDTL